IIVWNAVMLCTPNVTLPAKKVHGTNAANMKIGYGMLPVSTFATLWNTSVAAARVTSVGRMAQANPTIDCRYRNWYWRRTKVSIRYRWDQSPRNTGPRPVVAVDIIGAILPSAGQLAASSSTSPCARMRGGSGAASAGAFGPGTTPHATKRAT